MTGVLRLPLDSLYESVYLYDVPADLIPSAEAAARLKLPLSTFHGRVRAGTIEQVMKLPGIRGTRIFDRAYIDLLAGQARDAEIEKWDTAGMVADMDLITSTEAGAILGKSGRTVIRMAEAGTLPYGQRLPGPNGAYLFDRAAIEALASDGAA